MTKRLLLLCVLFNVYSGLSAQFIPNSIYREYVWTTPETGEAFIRVGGKNGYQNQPGELPGYLQRGKQLLFPDSFDLFKAASAEVIVERVLSHEDSRNLSISFNGNTQHYFGEPSSIPAPASEYMYHTSQRIKIPIGELNAGANNSFSLELDTNQRWNWPQNLVYAIILRITYFPDKSTVSPPVIRHASPAEVPENSVVSIAANSAFVAVDYALEATDTDWGGSGDFHGVHWQTLRGKANRTIGSSDVGPDFPIQWTTTWLPNQRRKMKLHARAIDREGFYHVGVPLNYLELAKRGHGIALIVPTKVPKSWVTRMGTFNEELELSIQPERVVAYQLLWTSWSPCYANGIYLNGHLLWSRSEICDAYAAHNPIYSSSHELRFLKAGTNVLATGKTPLFNGELVNGMEVQWPGIMMKIRY